MMSDMCCRHRNLALRCAEHSERRFDNCRLEPKHSPTRQTGMRKKPAPTNYIFVVLVAALSAAGCSSDLESASSPASTVPASAASSTGESTSASTTPAEMTSTTVDIGRLPDREPDVTGVATAQGSGFALARPSDDYFGGMMLARREAGAEPIVVGPDGNVLSIGALRDGDDVAVWVATGCAESRPVQCDVVAIRVTSPITP